MSSSAQAALPQSKPASRGFLRRLWDGIGMSLLALFTAFLLGGVVIWITSGSINTVVEAYAGLFRGAFR